MLELESEEVSGAHITKAAVTGRKSNKGPPCIKAMEAHGAGKKEADGHQNWNYCRSHAESGTSAAISG